MIFIFARLPGQSSAQLLDLLNCNTRFAWWLTWWWTWMAMDMVADEMADMAMDMEVDKAADEFADCYNSIKSYNF